MAAEVSRWTWGGVGVGLIVTAVAGMFVSNPFVAAGIGLVAMFGFAYVADRHVRRRERMRRW